jgi:hypothetical protein
MLNENLKTNNQLNDTIMGCNQTTQLQTNPCLLNKADNINTSVKKDEFAKDNSNSMRQFDKNGNDEAIKNKTNHSEDELASSEENSISASDVSASKMNKSSVLASSSQFFPWMKRIHGNQYG